jgi:hypothetical protein
VVAAGDGLGEERQRDRESRAQFEFGERITDSEESSEEMEGGEHLVMGRIFVCTRIS